MQALGPAQLMCGRFPQHRSRNAPQTVKSGQNSVRRSNIGKTVFYPKLRYLLHNSNYKRNVKTWFQNRRAKWRRLKQENPQATKKEVEGADSHSDQRPESCPTPEQKGKEVSLDGSQYTPSPASQEDLESDVSDDSDQEVDIEGDKGYYNPTH
nr:PREDICTED: hematopoietically-expressed homeobox protein HHEX [Opisthocomus hoazin]